MQTKMLLKKTEPDSGKTNTPVNNNHKNKPTENKKNVRTTDYKKLLQMMLNDPDSITREEFLFLQSIIGYRQAVAAREKAKLRKQQRKIEQTNAVKKPILLERKSSEIGNGSDREKGDTSSEDDSAKTPIQMKKDEGNTSASSSSMQYNLKAGLEQLSGIDLSDVKVHENSDKPQQVGALAYTQGNDIHIAPGQEKHLPHEGWHAVQQKQGRVKPTMQMKAGAPVNDDAGLEKEADVMGSKAVIAGSKGSIVQLQKSPLRQKEITVLQKLVDMCSKKAQAATKKSEEKGTSKYQSVGNEYFKWLSLAEGVTNYPYLDTADNTVAKSRKNVTLGIGYTFDIKGTGWNLLKKNLGWTESDIKTIIDKVYSGENMSKSKYTISDAQMQKLLNDSMQQYITATNEAINKYISKYGSVIYTQTQFDAMVDFAYNNGPSAVKDIDNKEAIIYYYLRKDQKGAVTAIKKYSKQNSDGTYGTRRRLNQMNLFFNGDKDVKQDKDNVKFYDGKEELVSLRKILGV